MAPVGVSLAAVDVFYGLPVYGVLAGSPRVCQQVIHPELSPLPFVVVRRRVCDDLQDAVDLRVCRRDGEEGAPEFCLVRL